MREKIELLSPAGDLNRCKIAILYGADAVYIGGKKFSLRSRASNFEIEDIAEAVRFANEHGSHIHVTVNMLPHEEDLEGLSEYLKELERVGVHAIICASLNIAMTAKRVAPKLEVHLSTQHSTLNSKAIEFWKSLGVDRVVLGRECSLEDIKQTTAHSPLPCEVFIHGGMCISYSGRCTLSNSMTNRDANRGGCAQSCRWKYRLFDEAGHQLNDGKELFSMSSKDLMAAAYIEDLIHAGVVSLKIEGRMKSTYYIACVVKAYRMLIDEIYEKGHVDEERLKFFLNELNKAENRPTAIGFYEGQPRYDAHLYGVNGAGVTQEFIASVEHYDEETQMATLIVRNHFTSGCECEAFGPHITNVDFVMGDCFDMEGNVQTVMNQPMQMIKTKLGFKVEKHDMIRRIMVKDRSQVY